MIIIQLESEQLDCIVQNAVRKALVGNVPTESKYVPSLWMDIQALCSYHPNKPTKATVYSWIQNNQVPYYKDKGLKRLRFLKSEIDEWLSEGRQKTKKEINAEPHLSLKKKRGAM
jgi:excisionase family DNA binding protein